MSFKNSNASLKGTQRRLLLSIVKLCALLAILCVTNVGKSQPTITFNSGSYVSVPGVPPVFSASAWLESDYLFTTPAGVTLYFSDTSFQRPYNGTTFMTFTGGPRQGPVTIQNTNNYTFSISSIDIAEYSTVPGFPRNVTFFGTRSDSSIVSVEFMLDGILDGIGPIVDFQTFYFPETFTDLIYLQADAVGMAIDNLTIHTVPEPTSGVILGVGMFLFSIVARQKANQLPPR